MKFFLDSAKLDEIEEAYESFGIDGVTTNPRHIQASGKPIAAAIEGMARWTEGKSLKSWKEFPVSVEINPHLEQVEDMVKEAKRVSGISPTFVIKIPCNLAGVTAARILEKEGVRTNLTLVFSPSQAIMAAKAGSLFVSPFYGWKEGAGEDALGYIKRIISIYRTHDYKTQILSASIRNGAHMVESALAGADIITAGLQVYKDSVNHPYLKDGLKTFCDAWDNTKK